MKTPKTAKPKVAKTVKKLLEQIRQKASGGDYIYRGENNKGYGKVSSTLYRDYQTETDAEKFDIAEVEKAIVNEVRERTHEKEDAILEQLQHYGGKTNQIDFSVDFFIALFFACDGNHKEDGRLILLNKKGVETHKPITPQNRVIAQKSIFVRSPKGFIEPDDEVTVPSELKKDVLEYLNKYHNINTATIYNDIHGYISQKAIHKSAYTCFYRGVTHQNKSEFDEAIKAYTEAIELNPNMAVIYNNRGNTYNRKGEYDLAIADHNKSIKLNPNDADAYFNRGNAYSKKRKYDIAMVDYNKAIELNPNFAAAYNNRGNTYGDKGEYDLALDDFNKSIKLNPNDANVYNSRGTAYISKEEYDLAIADFNKVIELNPNYAEAYANLGITKKLLQNYKEAKEHFKIALQLAKQQGKESLVAGIQKENKLPADSDS